jgi:hypothetical protein
MTDRWLLLLLCCLAVYRGARMVAKEDGPFSLFTTLRNLRTADKDWIAVGIRCPLCIGFWLALPAALVYAVWAGDVWLWPLYWLGIAGGAVFLRKFWLERDE